MAQLGDTAVILQRGNICSEIKHQGGCFAAIGVCILTFQSNIICVCHIFQGFYSLFLLFKYKETRVAVLM